MVISYVYPFPLTEAQISQFETFTLKLLTEADHEADWSNLNVANHNCISLIGQFEILDLIVFG